MDSKQIISKLNLTPHPEGGYFKEFYRSKELTANKLSLMTSVYFLLEKGQKSLLHKIPSTEVWNHVLGDPLVLVTFDSNGAKEEKISATDNLDAVVAGNTWMGSYLPEDSEFSLVTCHVSPGFEFDSLEFAKREELLNAFPQEESLIKMLTN